MTSRVCSRLDDLNAPLLRNQSWILQLLMVHRGPIFDAAHMYPPSEPLQYEKKLHLLRAEPVSVLNIDVVVFVWLYYLIYAEASILDRSPRFWHFTPSWLLCLRHVLTATIAQLSPCVVRSLISTICFQSWPTRAYHTTANLHF